MLRRSFLRTAAGLLVAPAIVRAESLMRVRPLASGGLVPGSLTYLVGGGHAAENFPGVFQVIGERFVEAPLGAGGWPSVAPVARETVRLSLRASAGAFLRVGDLIGIADGPAGGPTTPFRIREIQVDDEPAR